MKDIQFDISARDCVMNNGDFTYQTNPSVQNGGLLLLARANNIKNLISGIGINQIIGGSVSGASYEMARWKSQVEQDGGKASVTTDQDASGNIEFLWEVNYV